jgi:DNA mismatch repair ATPase MutL
MSITDDGNGIKKEHFEYLCKTHYTTKDKGTNSFGYRGEALSYINRNCKVTI